MFVQNVVGLVDPPTLSKLANFTNKNRKEAKFTQTHDADFMLQSIFDSKFLCSLHSSLADRLRPRLD